MFLLTKFCVLSSLLVSIQILAVNAGISSLFPNVKLLFGSSKILLADIALKFNASISSFNTFYSSYSKNLKTAAGELISNLYSNVNVLISSSSDLITHFKMEYHDYPCSKFNVTAFDFWIKRELFGQHIIDWYMSKLLKDHLNTDKLRKPLIMSFHGQIGCGKTLVSKMIVESLFKEGLHSKFVHVYHGSLDFPHEKNKEKYREKLEHDILLSSHLCNRSVFIFEEVDNMIPGVIDALIPQLYGYKNSSMEPTKNIFLFLSNSGSKKIDEIMYDAWLKGIPREDMTLDNFACHLKEAAYNQPGGLQHSELVDKNFIDMFVPFLPLEKKHVKQCIIKELKLQEKSINKDIVEKIANQFEYHPSEFELFSVSGCKRVAYKVDLYGDTSL